MSGIASVRILVLPSGERLPVLIERSTGQPFFDPLIYVVGQLRGRAANTIIQHLAGIHALLKFCSARHIDLAERVRSGRLFATFELDALVAALRMGITRDGKTHLRPIARETAGNRLRAIRAYLTWLTNRRRYQLAHSGEKFDVFEVSQSRLLIELSARLPSHRKGMETRTGLTIAQRRVLLEVVDPASDVNPWISRAAKTRNCAIVWLLYELGLRRGELLALRIEDVDFRQARLAIVRRPDDRRDPRARQPVAKTEERLLEIGPQLAKLLSEYILQVRSGNPAARRHGYVFVDCRHGAPLTPSAVDKIFAQLRRVDGLPSGLSSHVLRHDWNDRFSSLMEEKRVDPADEMRFRKYLQGWRWDGSAQRYNRRHNTRRANEALLDMQRVVAKRVPE